MSVRSGGFSARLLAALLVLWAGVASAQARQIVPFDAGWRFVQADVPGAEAPGFIDEGWSRVDLPHDWAINGPFEATNASGGQGAFAPAGVGWYRRHFAVPQGGADKRVFVEFDGVMANSDVWINGVALGHRPSGYVSFRYELTGRLRLGASADNVLAVRADNAKQPASRWYEGAGIYRHVRLLVLNSVHTVGATTFVSTPKLSGAAADIKIMTEVRNDSDQSARIVVRATVLAPDGRRAAIVTSTPQSIGAGQQGSFDVMGTIVRPDRWDIGHPALYRAQVEVLAGGKVTDLDPVTFGIREFHFDPDTGFWLNGRNVKLKGVALHFDVGSLGTAAPLGAWEHRLAAMRTMGANAIRTAHDPVAPEFLDLCDRMGWLVMDEMFDQWTVAKNAYDYHLYFRDWYLRDVHDTVLRDRNHPSIILYSAGNEIHDTPNAELAKSILGPMVAKFHKDDPTRPVTQALFRPNVSHDYEDGLADMLDVIGQNYRPAEILAAHEQKPTRKIVGTENTHGPDQWLPVRDNPAYSGEFLWAGTDYLGESRHWPLIGDASGMNDRTDAAKPDSLERESWWSDVPVVHLVRRTAPTPLAPTDPGYETEQYRPRPTVFADWTPKERTPHREAVEVYSNCPQVELFLNEQALGAKARNADDSPRRWTVNFAAGALRAVGKDGGKPCASETLRTAGPAAKLNLSVERARLSMSFDDVAYVRATVVDAEGTPVPDASPTLIFSVTGPGRILATDSGDNADHSGFQHPDRVAFHGRAIAIVRATAPAGTVSVYAASQGLGSTSIKLAITPSATVPGRVNP